MPHAVVNVDTETWRRFRGLAIAEGKTVADKLGEVVAQAAKPKPTRPKPAPVKRRRTAKR